MYAVVNINAVVSIYAVVSINAVVIMSGAGLKIHTEFKIPNYITKRF